MSLRNDVKLSSIRTSVRRSSTNVVDFLSSIFLPETGIVGNTEEGAEIPIVIDTNTVIAGKPTAGRPNLGKPNVSQEFNQDSAQTSIISSVRCEWIVNIKTVDCDEIDK